MTETKKAPDATTSGDLEEIQTGHDPTATDGPCVSHADIGGACYHCDPYWRVVREMDESLRERDHKREQERRQAIDEYLTGRYAVYAPSGATLRDFLRVLDRDEVETLREGDEVETTSDRLLNHADAEGLLLVGDYPPDADLLDTPSKEWTDEQRERFEAHLDQDPRHVLFFTVNERTAVLLTDQHKAEHADVRVFPACVGLPPAELSARFHAEGLGFYDYSPYCEPTPLVADQIEKVRRRLSGVELSHTWRWWVAEINAMPELDPVSVDEDPEPVHAIDDEDGMTDVAPPPNAPLDLRRLRTEPRKPVEYLEPGIYPRGRYVGLSGEAGAGKSILVRDMAVHWSLGRSALDPNHRFEPAQVVYLDAENGPDWWHEGLDKMDAPLDLPNLRVICYPELADGLDTERGARSFLELVESLGDIDVLILDTISRFVAGGENDSDTWHGVYRNAILPLRRAGIGVLRLDHIGKNAELGARGSSAKMSDLDAHFMLSAPAKGSNDLTLKLDKRRQADYAETAKLTRRDGPLGHLRLPDGKLIVRIDEKTGREVPEDPKVAALVAELDRLHISAALTRDVQQEMYREKGGREKARATVWSAARKFRSERIDREAKRG